jgi:predicted HTH transcriptional regulator
MLPTLPSAEEIAAMDTFPYPEGRHFEYKKSTKYADKVLSTICAFLNSDGGYMIFGIEDTTLKMMGVNIKLKEIDTFILTVIDSIYHELKIVRQDNKEPLHINNIEQQTIKLKNGKYILIIKVVPEAGVHYQLHDGLVYHRLNASNMKIRNERIYTELEVDNIVNQYKRRIEHDYNILINEMSNQLRHNVGLVHTIGSSKDSIKKSLDEVQDLLFKRILAEKAEKEEELLIQSTTSWCSFAGIFQGFFTSHKYHKV